MANLPALSQSSAPAPHVSQKPATGEEQVFEKSLTETRIGLLRDLGPVTEALRYVMVLIGLRAANWPEEAEKAVLVQFIVSEYGGHTVSEIRLAFTMAIQGKLGVEVNCYENFSVLYFASIMNAYREWAREVYRKLETKAPELPKALPAIDWRGLMEIEYQLFLQGKAKWRTWPPEFYDTAVEDEYIAAPVYREQMQEARQALCGDLQKKIAVAQAEAAGDAKRYSGLRDLENRLIEYRNGSRDAEIILLAKQYCVLLLFQKAMQEQWLNLYTPL